MGSEVWEGWGSVLLLSGTTIAGILVIGIVLWQSFKTIQAWIGTRADSAREQELRRLVAEATDVQRALIDQQKGIAREISELRASVGKMERLLREVE